MGFLIYLWTFCTHTYTHMHTYQHHHVMVILLAQISLTVFCHSPPSLLAGPLEYILCLFRAVVDGFWLVIQCMSIWRDPLENVTYKFVLTSPVVSRMSCSSYLDGLQMGGRWPYSCCFVICCHLDLFNITHSNLVQFLFSFFSKCLVSIHVVHLYSRINTTAA